MQKMNITQVYNLIADDFSKTRFKAWPAVSDFIDSFHIKSINADIGCGNGKNILYRPELNFKGMDITPEFVKICNQRNLDVVEGNILSIPFESNIFDNVICIAVLHHLENKQDRIDGICELLRIAKKGGMVMIYVWAFEQPPESKRQFDTQDEMVSFKKRDGTIYYRYYHLYKQHELEEEINCAVLKSNDDLVVTSGYERGNWYVIIKKL
jgi:SAM-dependent methyltransferase